ncbi:hypothetical protein IV203_026529 [Nitzschia inconspicua]|uniref:DDE Tnp4 domain-containing protein n=1 Tax=Nitzschia inconspicua TaxID=303405 RepID=A0A9K3LIR9_9STRA|nr:hypothetical protein IV203_026529 [Nitzschia inconspicua]
MDSSSSSSSSSSSDDELFTLPPVRAMLFGEQQKRSRKVRYRRIDWDEHVAEKLATNTFHTRYRMTYTTFQRLVDMLDITVDEKQSKRSTGGNTPIKKELVVAGGIRYLAGGSRNDVADILGVSDTSMTAIIDKFLSAVLSCEQLKIKAPTTTDELRQVDNGFRRISTAPGGVMNGCVGALDGWVVTIVKPRLSEVENVMDYRSGHYQCYGLVVLAISDSRLKFTYCSVAGTGRTNDVRAFRRLPTHPCCSNSCIFEKVLRTPTGMEVME